MGRLDGKVALITGVARGQGRSHALRLASEGADIIGLDALTDVPSVNYPMATQADLDETVAAVEGLDRLILATKADVRDADAVDEAVAAGLARFGHIDIVLANAGVASFAPAASMDRATWDDMLAINLGGVWNTVRAAIPSMIEADRGGSIVLTSSVAGLMGLANIAHYVTAKHGLTGLMRTLAIELGPHRIRVNTVNPTNVATDMIFNDATRAGFRPDLDTVTEADQAEAALQMHVLPIPWIDALDVSNAIAWLVSDEARYVTGVTLPIDAGATLK